MPVFYWILNMKMKSQSLSNFTDLLVAAHSSMEKFDNDCDIVLCPKFNSTEVFME